MEQGTAHKKVEKWILAAAHLAGILPLVLFGWAALQGKLGFNPIETALQRSGRAAVFLLLLSLAVTPLRRLLNIPPLGRIRKPLGLYAALYAGLHLGVFAIWDYGLNLNLIWREFVAKPFLLVGLAALVILAILAVTSTRQWQVKLRTAWRWLHRTVYLAAVFAIVHYLLAVKGDLSSLQGNYTRPLIAGGVLLFLLLLRLPFIIKHLQRLLGRT